MSLLVLYETLHVPVLMYGNKTMLWKEKERSSIRVVQMNNIRGKLGVRRMDRIPNSRIRELYGVTKEIGERIDEDVLRWFGHMERRKNDRIAKRFYI